MLEPRYRARTPSGFIGWPPGTQRGRRGFSAIIVGVGVHEGLMRLFVTLVVPAQRLSSRGTAMG